MDLLAQYKKQNPEAFREQKSVSMADAYGREYSGMTALVIRLSVGRIRDARTASIVLLSIAVGIGIVSLYLFFGFGSTDMENLVPYQNTQNQGQIPESSNSYPTLTPKQ